MMGNCSNRAVLLIDMPKTWKVLGRQTGRQAGEKGVKRNETKVNKTS